MGCLLWANRHIVEKVGYMDVMKGFYGFEHSLWSNRINGIEGKEIDWFPVLKSSGRFFTSQNIPNNYKADYSDNQKGWNKRKPEIARGINLYVGNANV